MLDLGDTIPFSSKLYDKPLDQGGVLVNATSAALTITLPDLTTVPGVVVPNPPAGADNPGKYSYPYVTTTQAGRYTGRWLFTMATGQTTAYVEDFDVRPADPGYIVSLADGKSHLNIPATTTTYDEELRDWLGGITAVIEDRVGPVVQRTVVERHESGPSLFLRRAPVLSLTSVVPWLTYGTTYDVSTLKFDSETGRVELKVGGWFYGPLAVTYQAGRPIVSANIGLAARIILKHLWESQRGAAALPLQMQEDVTFAPGLGFAVPNRALELLRPDAPPGVG